MEAICSSEMSVDKGLHGIVSQKMALFITTAVRTSNPTNSHLNDKPRVMEICMSKIS
jgi:hypothetical protein